MSEKHDKGMAVRRKVLGDAHVDKTIEQKTDFDADFQDFITEGAWGSVWARDGALSLRDRSLLTLTLLASAGHDKEFEMHIRACKNTGATKEDVKETLLHMGVYVGVPISNHYIKIAKKIYDEMDKENS
ncbi:MAG: 4-carboxymuconolactone decarboxylase [Kordiimonadaceae bacterium]|nr:4-carboxymuconolactone decarboxylase [Kordiimonadaceae bacterium]MBT6031362.1 4-carboxymuconolactone decarboxylase [Kordiimonadaceae bacterium]